MKDDKAFTGLEAAIIFIAFIVVASVFSYMALGAGFFATQSTQNAIYTAVQQTGSVVRIIEPVIVQATADGQHVRYIVVRVGVPEGGSVPDAERISICVSTSDTLQYYSGAALWHPVSPDAGFWEVRLPMFRADDPALLADVVIGPNRAFCVEVKPSDAVPLSMQRTAPSAMRPDNWYEVW